MADQPTGQNQDPATSQVADQNTGVQPDPDQGDGQGADDGQEPGRQGGAEARIRRLAAEKKRLAEEAEHWKNIATRFAQVDDQQTQNLPVQNPNQNQYGGDEVETAFRTLVNRGVATQDDLQKVILRMKWDQIHNQNESRFNKSGSRYPEYNREEVEEYAKRRNIGDPTAAYRDMYFDEIIDAVKSENRGRPAGDTTERPTKPTNHQKEPLTLESFRKKMATDRAFYDDLAKDPAKFDAIMTELAQQQ